MPVVSNTSAADYLDDIVPALARVAVSPAVRPAVASAVVIPTLAGALAAAAVAAAVTFLACIVANRFSFLAFCWLNILLAGFVPIFFLLLRIRRAVSFTGPGK